MRRSPRPTSATTTRLRAKTVGLGILVSALVLLTATAAFSTTRGRNANNLAASLAEVASGPILAETIVVWQPDPELDRPVGPKTRQMVEEAIVRGWTRIDKSQASGQTRGIDTWFVGALADNAAVGAESGPSGSVLQHGHLMAVTFFSIDGSIMTLDVNSVMTRRIDGGPDVTAQETFEVVMLLSDGNWRTLHLSRTDVTVLDVPDISVPDLRALAPWPGTHHDRERTMTGNAP